MAPMPPCTAGQLTVVPYHDRARPFRGRLRQILREDEGIAAAIGAVDGQDGVLGQRNAGVQSGNGRIIPRGDLAAIDAGQNRTAEVQIAAVQPRQVVDDILRRDGERNVQHVRVLLDLRAGHIGVRSADLGDTRHRLSNTGAAAGALGRDADVRINLAVTLNPEVEERIEQAGARLEDRDAGGLGYAHHPRKSQPRRRQAHGFEELRAR